MPVERRSSLRKAPEADVVDALTGTQQPEPSTQAESQQVTVEAHREPAPRRKKRIMLPFSSKIEMNLRDEMDAYLAEHGISIVDFLDEAIRDRLAK